MLGCKTALAHKNCYIMCITIHNKIPKKPRELSTAQLRKEMFKWLIAKYFYNPDFF